MHADDFIWSLESLLTTLCATVETCLQVTAAGADSGKAGAGQSSAVVTANLQLYFLLLVLVRACLRILLTKLKSGVFVLETAPAAGSNALTESSFAVTTNVSGFLQTLLEADRHLAQYVFANARSLPHIAESAIWGGCLGSGADTGAAAGESCYSLARVDVIQLFSVDYCISIADYFASTRLLRMADDAASAASGRPVRREEGSDEGALRCMDYCVAVLHTVLNSTQNPECAAHKLKLLMLPLVSHIYTVLYYSYSCVYRLVCLAHQRGQGSAGKAAANARPRQKKLDIYGLSFEAYRELWDASCDVGGAVLSAVSGLTVRYLGVVREYLNAATAGGTGGTRVDEKFRKQLIQCHGLDAEKPALASVVSGAGAAALSAADSPFNPLETPLVLLLFHAMFALQHNPEVSLYSVRVLAKLTVLEQVRQICYR
jgi:hypothetical protein